MDVNNLPYNPSLRKNLFSENKDTNKVLILNMRIRKSSIFPLAVFNNGICLLLYVALPVELLCS